MCPAVPVMLASFTERAGYQRSAGPGAGKYGAGSGAAGLERGPQQFPVGGQAAHLGRVGGGADGKYRGLVSGRDAVAAGRGLVVGTADWAW